MEYIQHYDSPLGRLTLASDGTALTGVWMEGQLYFARTLASEHEETAVPVLSEASRWLDAYFRGENPEILFPLAPAGSPFRQAVWKRLLEIPYGKTTTYGAIVQELTRQTGRRMAARAVGSAVGQNPISIIIPCHRVLGANGKLTGYAGGLARKKQLLQLENAAI